MPESIPPLLEPVSSDDAEQVEIMAKAIWPTVYGDIISSAQIQYMLGWMYSPEKIRTEIEEEDIFWFWIEFGKERIGFLSGGPLSDGFDFTLHKIYLLPEFHGSGLGSRAMSELFTYVEEQGGKRIHLRVNRENTVALFFYERKGFQLTGMDQADIGGGFIMDDCLLTKQL